MSRKTKILSFLLALVLAFGCMTTTLFAVAQTEVQGGEITEEDIQNGTTDAITGTAHPNSGIKTADEIAALIGEDKIAFKYGDSEYTNHWYGINYVNGAHTAYKYGGFYTTKTDSATNEKYISIGASTIPFVCGKSTEVYFTNTNTYGSSGAVALENYDKVAGKDFVVGIDFRLTDNVDDSFSATLLRIESRFLKDSVDAADYVVKNERIQRYPLTIHGDGSIVIEKGYMANGVAYTLPTKVQKGADVPFSNVSVHVHPSTNSFDVYIDGVCQTEGVNTVLLENSQLKKVAYAYGAEELTTDAQLYEQGKKNFVFSVAVFLHMNKTYHGENCPDTCTATKTEGNAPFNFVGEQIHVDTIKAYYSDLFLECSGSSENITVAEGHTHNEENLTVATSVVCNNCKAKWNVVIPMDQTGNSLCDLCEIANKNQNVSEFHNAKQIKEAANVAEGFITVKDGSVAAYANKSLIATATDENGNTYYTFGTAVTDDAYDLTYAGDPITKANTQALIKSGDNTKRGQSFVLQADIKLGENFSNQAKAMGLFRIRSYSNLTFTRDEQYLAQIKTDGKLYVNKDGGRYTPNYEICKLSTETYTTIALHVKTGASSNKYGSYDVYINGEIRAENIPLFTKAVFEEYFGTEGSSYTIDGKTVACQGIKDYILSEVNICRVNGNNSALQYDDVYQVDNLMAYYSDEYESAFTRHEYKTNSHTHDYSKKCIKYGTSCKYCLAGQGGYAVLDADGDKICDYCLYDQLDVAKGPVSADSLAALLDSADKIKFSSTISESTPYGFSSVAGNSGLVYGSVGDNKYLEYTTGSGNVYPVINVEKSADLTKANIAGYDGHSFVLSIDVKLGLDYSAGTYAFTIRNAMTPSTTDENGKVTSLKTDMTYDMLINADGSISYRDGSKGKTYATETLEGVYLTKGASEFTTIAMHVRPGYGNYGQYDIYVDGELKKSNIQLFSAAVDSTFTWESADEVKSNGAKDYTVYDVRVFNVKTQDITDVSNDGKIEYLYIDNPKFYYSEDYDEHAEHEYKTAGEHTHNLNNKTIEITMECACGHKDLITLPIDTTLDGACDTCNNFILDGGVFVTARQAILDDMISMKFYAQISAETAANPEAYAVLTAGNRTERYKLSELTANSDGLYEFTIKLRSIDLASDITMAIEIDGVPGEQEFTATARDYIEDLMAVTDLAYVKDICVAILNYGAAAQTYFAEKNKDDTIKATLANAGLTDEQKALVGSVSKDTLKNYEMSITGEATDVVFNAATLVLDSTVSVKIFFTAPEGAAVTLNGTEVTPVKAGSEYYITIADLLPQELDTAHTIVVTTGTATKTLTLSTLSTIYQLLIASDEQVSASFKDLGRAIYLYNLAADAYKVFEGDSAVSATANVVVKNDAKGATAIIFDDGSMESAGYIAEYLETYENTAASFALIAKNYATLTQDNLGNYEISEDGKYVYSQDTTQESNTTFWQEYQTTWGDRVEFLNHSYTHAEGDNYAEILGAKHIIQGLFGYESQTFVVPGFNSGTRTEEYNNLAAELNIVCRGTKTDETPANMVSTLNTFKEKRDFLPAFMVNYAKFWLTEEGKFNSSTISAADAINADENGKADASYIEAYLDAAIASGGLAAFCFHGVVEDTYLNGENSIFRHHIYKQQAEALFAAVEERVVAGELWSATFGEVCEYYCEWSTSSLDVRELRDGVLAINLTDMEDDAVCNTRLTVKISVADDWTGATLNQGSYTEEVEVKGEAGAKYVLVNVLPDGGIATLSAN